MDKNVRLIARLDVKAPNLVKGIQLEGLRKLGNPNDYAKKYYSEGIDEILYVDIVASLYERNSLSDIIIKATQDIFVPITVGGGLRTLDDVEKVLSCGADKIAINTAAIKKPDIITQVANKYGSQCMVLSIQAKRTENGKWEAYYDNGREHTGMNVVEWVRHGYELGAGEILLTSVDQEGTMKGYDVDLVREVADIVPIPVIACGGMGCVEDVVNVVNDGHADAVAVASVLHYDKICISDIKNACINRGINMRGNVNE